MTTITFLVVLVVFLSLAFDFLNGFHDAANSISTVVVARTLTPLQAVILAGMMNFIGYFTFGHAIARMVSKGIVNLDFLSTPEAKLTLLLGALLGAIVWNIITWLLGLPTSSSHALMGGLVGAGIAAAGPDILVHSSVAIHAGKLSFTGVLPIIAFIVIAPLLGMLGAGVITLIIFNLFKNMPFYHSAKVFRYLQLCSASCYSAGHGTNDAQKMMGVITLALVCGGTTTSWDIKPWVAFACYFAIALGTTFGGWRIVKTMGTKITKIRSIEGFCAESSSAMVLMSTAHFGIPVSTTHVISGAIMGVGTVEGARMVKWATARKLVLAWFLTIPLAASCAAVMYWLISFLH
jgi:inorganic phosphate transporter, PiT family